MLRVGDEEDDICHPITRWEHLPPLPEPKRCEMRMEASGGTVLVLALVAVFTGMTQGVALGPGKLTGAWWWLFFCLIYGEAACAIGCLLGIMWGDPGVVKRSEETCFPIPAEVADRLRRGLSLEQMGNVTEDGRTYCIRCLLWRPGGLAGRSTVHHCGTCQRCVVDFDHHCGVFGRCIAGKGLKGNFKYFSTIIVLGYAGAATATAALMLGVLKCSRGNWWGSWTNIVLLTFAGYVAVAAAGWFVVATCQCAGAILDFLCDRCPAPRGRGDAMR